MNRRPRRFCRLSATLTAGLLGCASSASCTTSPSLEEFSDPDVEGRDTNPDGVPYPTDHLGGAERAGSRPGQRIPNFTFMGYPEADRTGGLRPISLADYYDPDQKRHKMLHLQVAATWCSICSSVCDATVKVKTPMESEGVVYLEVLVSGVRAGFGPNLDEVDDWMTRHAQNYSVAVDVRARRLGSIGIDGSVMPWDVLIDTRTMEILDSSGGAPADLVRYDRDGLNFIAKTPPAYGSDSASSSDD